MKLVIVESPTKSKTIQKFLDKEYRVVSSYGHVRDLPKTRLGIDVDNNFEPKYQIIPKARNTVKELKELLKKSEEVLLATDPDREGEAISWHLISALQLDKLKTKPYKRIVFHEVTKKAIEDSLNNAGEIDLNLVDAQQARRALDRIVGYKLSPLLWQKIARRLSAGRVQSVALKLIVDREKEIESFNSEEYWSIQAQLENKNQEVLLATLVKINKDAIKKTDLKTKKDVDVIISELEKADYLVSEVQKKETIRNPYPPFITSTLQQESYKKFRFSSKLTMRLAQQLYEKGLITYHRTDSFNLSEDSLTEARKYIIESYGEKYFKSRNYKTKKRSQEAHEAIRPTSLKEKSISDKNQKKLYDLIKQRFVASQMASAVFDSVTIQIEATSNNKYILKSSGQLLKFDGFLKEYSVKYTESEIPDLQKNELLSLLKLIPEQHFTQPPARYNEASLVKALEEKEIGRPSTYASIISTIQERYYVEKNEERRFKPTSTGTAVSDLLSEHFPEIVDVNFTSKIEKELDLIAEGKVKWQTVMENFYRPFEDLLKRKTEEIKKIEPLQRKTGEKCEKCGGDMIYKIGRFGEFIACSNYPECKNTKEIEEENSIKEKCEKCGGDMILKRSRFGTFLGCSNYPECKNIKKNETSTGVSCPECKKGEIVLKKGRGGRKFYACNQYPKCKFASSQIPEEKKKTDS